MAGQKHVVMPVNLQIGQYVECRTQAPADKSPGGQKPRFFCQLGQKPRHLKCMAGQKHVVMPVNLQIGQYVECRTKALEDKSPGGQKPRFFVS